jgi:hypothetical protein
MIKRLVYSFANTSATGLDEVPLNSPILIEDSNGSGKPYQIILIDKTGIDGLTSINDLLTSMKDKWTEVSSGGLIVQNPNTLTEDYALESGFSGVVASGFTIADGVTLTIPTGSVLSVV